VVKDFAAANTYVVVGLRSESHSLDFNVVTNYYFLSNYRACNLDRPIVIQEPCKCRLCRRQTLTAGFIGLYFKVMQMIDCDVLTVLNCSH